jgi:hypothetical protein
MKRNNKPNRTTDLEKEISRLTIELTAEKKWSQILKQNCEEADKLCRNHRKLLKYHSLVLIILNLLSSYTDRTDIGKAIQININKYYKGLTHALMTLPIYDDNYDDTDEEFEDEEDSDDAGSD